MTSRFANFVNILIDLDNLIIPPDFKKQNRMEIIEHANHLKRTYPVEVILNTKKNPFGLLILLRMVTCYFMLETEIDMDILRTFYPDTIYEEVDPLILEIIDFPEFAIWFYQSEYK